MRHYAEKPEFELTDKSPGAVRYLEHGSQSELIRWHCHEEYELHLISSGNGKVFIGDYIGSFSTGQLILTGPRLPHNWVSHQQDGEVHFNATKIRDRVLHFDHEVITNVTKVMPEARELLPLMERAKSGILFNDFPLEHSEKRLIAIRESSGIQRMCLFFDFLEALINWPDYTLLSTTQIDNDLDEKTLEKINLVVNFVTNNFQQTITLSDASSLIGMSESHFSRYFKNATGIRFIEFVNRIRINRVCELLVDTDLQVTTICYRVGFNNVANFNRRFAELKGVTPRDYRRQAQARFSRPQSHPLQKGERPKFQ